MRVSLVLLLLSCVYCISLDNINKAVDYFMLKEVTFVCYFSCDNEHANKLASNKFLEKNMRVAVKKVTEENVLFERFLLQWTVPVGVLMDTSCDHTQHILDKASQLMMFDAAHVWLVFINDTSSIDVFFEPVSLSIDADIVVAQDDGERARLKEVFSFGKVQGNGLETNELGSWGGEGLNIVTEFKYYRRWDFHNLTLRAVSVIVERPKVFRPEMLSELGYTVGVAAMTKVVGQLLNVLRGQHNFRFNYTIAGRWIGAPERNSTLAVTNSLFWREQDISCTCARIYPKWMEWVDIFFPPATKLETKFYYLIPDKGVGDYENRFLTPMSPGVWWCSCAALLACAAALAAAAAMEGRPKPGVYALFSVIAALCQQARRVTLLVVGLTSMLLYNYYTSSVVSWLLNAAVPSIAGLDGLMASDLELVFENIGYAKQWLDKPGFYYFTGYKNVKEDELRDKKVTRAKKTVAILQPAEAGMELIRHGAYAYHTEPYTASQAVARTFEDRDLCALGSLQMMPPSQVYIMGQKRSPYGQFFIWSMMRLLERGHTGASRARVGGAVPACSGRTPRALALGQAAPAFALLTQLAILAACILMLEITWHRFAIKNRRHINRWWERSNVS